MLNRRKALDRAVAAVVVSEQKALAREELARTAAAELNNSVLQRGLIHRVDILGSELEALASHILDA